MDGLRWVWSKYGEWELEDDGEYVGTVWQSSFSNKWCFTVEDGATLSADTVEEAKALLIVHYKMGGS